MLDTYLLALAGGILIGTASSGLMLFNGRIAGISGIFDGAFKSNADASWKRSFVAGLLAGGFLLVLFMPEMFPANTALDGAGFALTASAGVLVGFGTRLGSGCTSGHGVCGMGRLSKRSFVAVITFITTGAITTFITRHVIGG